MILTAVLVSPQGNFPLIDDHFYADNVRVLIQEQSIFVWTKALALAHTLWGTLFTLAFGKDYTSLRISTLVMAVITLWLFVRLARDFGISYPRAFLCGAVLFVNPLFLVLSYTFMTDIPFMAWSLAGALFTARALEGGKDRDLFLGSLFSVVATSIRQVGIALPLAFLLAALFMQVSGSKRWSVRQAVFYTLPWLLGLLAFAALPQVEAASPHLLSVVKPPLSSMLHVFFRSQFRPLVYLGLFLLPVGGLLALKLFRNRVGWQRWQWYALPFVSFAIFLGSTNYSGKGFFTSRMMPLTGPILYDLGVGPMLLNDTFLQKLGNPVSLGNWWWAVTVLSILSFAALAVHCLPPFLAGCRHLIRMKGEQAREDKLPYSRALFLLLWGGITLMAPYDLIQGFTIDRYYLPALPPLMIFTVLFLPGGNETPALGRAVSWVLCAMIYLFSLAGVQDFMAWNTARWEGIRYLRHELKVPDWKIEGGLEYNVLFTMADFRKLTGNRPYYGGPIGWFAIDDSFAISYHLRKGTRVLRRVPYFSWLGMQERHILVLARLDVQSPG